MGVDNTISGGRDRLVLIQKALRDAPSSAVLVVLSDNDDRTVGIRAWERSEWSDALAPVVEQEALEHHETAERSDSKYLLTFLDGQSKSKLVRSFTVRTRREFSADFDMSRQLDGTKPAENALVQNAAFALAKLYMNAMQGMVNAQTQTIKELSAINREAHQSERRAREEYHELRELLVEMKEANAQVDPTELTPAQQKFFELATQFGPALLAKLGG